MRFDLIRLALCLLTGGCGATQPADPPPVRLLFIGNSLTYSWDLPSLVAGLLSRATTAPVEVRMVAYPNYGLTEHRLNGTAVTALREGGWDLVIMQQGPSSLVGSRLQLVAEARWFAGEAHAAGSEVAMLEVWPSVDRLFAFDDVRESYQQAADSAGGVFLPAGEAWRAAWRRDSTMQLYDKDGFHPSPRGSYLAALVVAGHLDPHALDVAPDTLVIPGELVTVTPAEKVILVAAAREVLTAPIRR